jgi:hypothetical protein
MTDSRDAVQQFTATTDAAVAQARLLAQDAVAQIDAGTYGCEAWGRSLVQLFDIVARGSATHFQTAVSHGCCGAVSSGSSGSCEGQCGVQPCDPIDVHQVDDNFSRGLSIAAALTRVGGGVSIPPNMIGFEPAVLAAGATSFAVYLKDVQYIGASYTGTVRLTRVTSDPGSVGYVDQPITVEL